MTVTNYLIEAAKLVDKYNKEDFSIFYQLVPTSENLQIKRIGGRHNRTIFLDYMTVEKDKLNPITRALERLHADT